MDDRVVASPALVTAKPIKTSVTTWVQKSMNTWETEGFEPVPDKDADNNSLDGIELEQLQLEAVPPYPKQFAGTSLLSLHDQIQSPLKQHQSSSRHPVHQTHPVQQSERHQAHHSQQFEEPRLFHPILIDPILEPSAYASPDSTSSMSSSVQRTQNVGKLIANKAREVAAHGAATCRALRNRLNL